MRSAGCIINDMVDRSFDIQVERTKLRPLACGELSMHQASILLGILLAISAVIALILGPIVVMWGVLALIPVSLYPFMKRISWWPQLFLGLTFNWGALMGWAYINGTIGLPALLLYAGCVCWTLGYDTIYAHQDKEDDKRIGIKSLALRLGSHTKLAVGIFYSMTIGSWLAIGWLMHCNLWYYLALLCCGLHFCWQIAKVDLDRPVSCQYVFKSNISSGFLYLGGILTGFL